MTTENLELKETLKQEIFKSFEKQSLEELQKAKSTFEFILSAVNDFIKIKSN